ncbi:MAG: DUF4249 domain-containing protein [Bacteroidota bacterium]
MFQSNKLSLILWLSLVTGMNLACQRFVDLQPNAEPLMAITSFVQAEDSVVQVEVYRQQVVGQTGGLDYRDFILTDAKVVVSNLTQDESVELAYDPEPGRYLAAVDAGWLRAQDQLSLHVAHPEYPAAKATCVIPSAPQGLSVRLDSVLEDWPLIDYFTQVSWQDDPQEDNFYRLIGKVKYAPNSFSSDPWFFRWEGLEANADYFTDEGRQGERLQSTRGNLQAVARQINGIRPPRQPGDSLLIQLLNIDVNYYEYMLDLREARFADETFSEPYQIYSNLEGGVGVFAAYHSVGFKARIK